MIERAYRLLKRDPSWRPITREKPDTGARTAAPRIRCPHCRWQPQPTSTWYCADCPSPEGLARGCGTGWNTFNTGGRCPGCAHVWRWTTCLACGRWSRHVEWYADRDE